jgi:type I restriction enzyme S subunit
MEMVNTKTTFPKYTAYKDSGVERLGEIPTEWSIKKVKHLCGIYNGDSLNESQKKKYSAVNTYDRPYISSKDINVDDASVNYENGLRIPFDNTRFKIAAKNSVLLCIEGGSAGKKIAFTNQSVCFVNKLACFNGFSNKIDKKYLFYSLKSNPFKMQFNLSMSGLIGGVAISLIKNLSLATPPLQEQATIAAFLDDKTAKIDRAIAQKERLISLLNERKQGYIQNVLIQGLNQGVELFDSGVDYIGMIPKHWEIKRLKYVLKERNERSASGEETLFMVSQVHGLVVRSEFHSKAEVAETTVGNKVVHENDLVFNKLKAHLGVFFKSTIKEKGLVSPDYAVYMSQGLINDLKYLELLFRLPKYIGQFIIRATGIVEGLIRLYTDDLFSIYIPLPPPSEQAEILLAISAFSKRIETAVDKGKAQIEKLKEYKATLIDSAVTGKIKVS